MSDDKLPPLSPLELRRIAPMSEAERLSSLSERTLRRRYPEKIRKLSPRRDGMTVGDILAIADENEANA